MNQKVETLLNKINSILDKIDPIVKDICQPVLSDEKFLLWPGAVEKHHAWDHGLLEHTSEVLDFAMEDYYHPKIKVNPVILASACIWHDYGKIWDYSRIERSDYPVYGKTDHYDLNHHISRSNAEFFYHAKNTGMKEELFQQISHCILAHHGRKEYGSPVTPQTKEAHILHLADMKSAFCCHK